jgi:hypothetical protein
MRESKKQRERERERERENRMKHKCKGTRDVLTVDEARRVDGVVDATPSKLKRIKVNQGQWPRRLTLNRLCDWHVALNSSHTVFSFDFIKYLHDFNSSLIFD